MRKSILAASVLVLTVGCTRSHSSSQSGYAEATSRPTVQQSPSNAVPLASSSSHAVASVVSSSATPVPSASVVASSPESASAQIESLPAVQVKNIGMHIGGGPNDRKTKAPIAESVKPHFNELRACWKYAENKTKGGTFGVDLLIPREGGKAEPSHPRSAIKGEAFEKCVLGVFERIEFNKPRTGKTMVSYSLRFTPLSQE